MSSQPAINETQPAELLRRSDPPETTLNNIVSLSSLMEMVAHVDQRRRSLSDVKRDQRQDGSDAGSGLADS
jgi:hypothetical protein